MLSVGRSVILLAGVFGASLGWAQRAPGVSAPAANKPGRSSTGNIIEGGAPQSPTGAVPTFRTGTQLVVVDVVVTDRNHQPVRGLTANDFSLWENGAPQTIKHVEEHTLAHAADATKFEAIPKLAPGEFTNYTPVAASGAVTILLLDSLNTPMADQSYEREQLLAYLKTRPRGSRIAIFGLNTQLVMLQGFTTDYDLLHKSVEHEGSKASFVLEDAVGNGGLTDPATDIMLEQFHAVHETFEIGLRTKYTLDAMSEIARYVSGIPGRKNLIWFSGSFPLDILPDENNFDLTHQSSGPFAASGSSESEYWDTITKLARSQVAVYPIDVRGITSSPVFGAAYGGGVSTSAAHTKYVVRTAAEHAAMEVLAGDTGGEAFFNTNGLKQAVEKAVEEGSNFYTLSYTPTNQEQDGKERKIKVALDRAGLELSYRKGYYTERAAKKVQQTEAERAEAEAKAREESVRVAMMRGAPTPTEILLKVAVKRMSPEGKAEDEVARLNKPAETTKGPYTRYGVDFAIDPEDLVMLRTQDGKIHMDYDALIYVYNGNGELLNWMGRTHPIAGTAEQVRRGTAHGLLAHEEISVPAKGNYFLRIAVHDRNRDRFGAVEVSTAQLTEAMAANAAPPAIAPVAGKAAVDAK